MKTKKFDVWFKVCKEGHIEVEVEDNDVIDENIEYEMITKFGEDRMNGEPEYMDQESEEIIVIEKDEIK